MMMRVERLWRRLWGCADRRRRCGSGSLALGQCGRWSFARSLHLCFLWLSLVGQRHTTRDMTNLVSGRLRDRLLLNQALETLRLTPLESQLLNTLLVLHFSLLDEGVGSWPLLSADFARPSRRRNHEIPRRTSRTSCRGRDLRLKGRLRDKIVVEYVLVAVARPPCHDDPRTIRRRAQTRWGGLALRDPQRRNRVGPSGSRFLQYRIFHCV